MWIKDRFGALINTHHLVGLFVTEDPLNTGSFIVRGNVYDPDTPSGENIASFSTNGTSTMTEEQAQSLRDTLGALLGAFDPAAL